MRCCLRESTGIGVMAMSLLLIAPAFGGERAQELTREDVVAALEQDTGPSKGTADAPVVMVDFSDFQCSYCGKFVKETLPKLEERYIRTG
ncbi:MAG TPA: thioredoxin domain-containing protein, partial [Candidatus Methylomirabilis sp.]